MQAYKIIDSRCDLTAGYMLVNSGQWWSNDPEGVKREPIEPVRGWTEDVEYFNENRSIELLVEAI